MVNQPVGSKFRYVFVNAGDLNSNLYFEVVEYYLSNMKHKAETKHNNGLS